MQRKRIIIAGPAHPLRGGLAAFNERLAQALQKEGHEVILYTFSLQYPGVLFPGKSQYSTDPKPEELDIRIRINSINPLNWISVAAEINKLKPDVLICRFWIPFIGPSLGTIARRVKRNRKTKVIGLLDNVIPHESRPGDKALTSWFLKSADGFVVMSAQVLSELRQFISDPKFALLPHPLYDYGPKVSREEACAKLQLDPSSKLLLFFGFIRNYKGLDLLLDAFAMALKDFPELHLVVAGEFYENEEPYLQQIKELGISQNITLHKDYIPDAYVKYYFSAADLVVQPYKSATQSGISQLAYHFEVPMVVTNVGGLPEIVPDGKAGYVTPVEKAAIAGAIVRYFRENKKAEFTAGLQREKIRFSWKHFTEGLDNLIQQL